MEHNADELIRAHYLFGGECQGVGFRWNTQHIAQELGLSGWVKNEVDGTVQTELQGTRRQISEFHGALRQAYQRWHVDYRLLEAEEIELIASETDFRVLF